MEQNQAISISALSVKDTLYMYYGPNNFNNRKLHIVARISDGYKSLIVYKVWLKHKQGWAYTVEPDYIFELWNSLGSLRRSLPKKK